MLGEACLSRDGLFALTAGGGGCQAAAGVHWSYYRVL